MSDQTPRIPDIQCMPPCAHCSPIQMTTDEEAVRAELAAIDRQMQFVHRVEDFYAGITYRATTDEPYVPSADLVDAATAAGASTSREFGDIYMRLVAAKRDGAGTIGGTL